MNQSKTRETIRGFWFSFETDRSWGTSKIIRKLNQIVKGSYILTGSDSGRYQLKASIGSKRGFFFFCLRVLSAIGNPHRYMMYLNQCCIQGLRTGKTQPAKKNHITCHINLSQFMLIGIICSRFTITLLKMKGKCWRVSCAQSFDGSVHD